MSGTIRVLRDLDPLAARRAPDQLAREHAAAEVERPLVLQQVGHRQLQRLVVDVEPDHLGVGRVDDRLPDPGEAEGLLGVLDRPGLVEAVDVGAVDVGVAALVVVAAHAEVAVADREQRLGRAEVGGRRSGSRPGATRRRGTGCGRAGRRPAARRATGRRDRDCVSRLRLAWSSGSSSARSATTTSAPASVSASAPAPRSTPITSAKSPAAPACDAADRVLDHDGALARSTPRSSAAAQEGVGRRLAGQVAARPRPRRARRSGSSRSCRPPSSTSGRCATTTRSPSACPRSRSASSSRTDPG